MKYAYTLADKVKGMVFDFSQTRRTFDSGIQAVIPQIHPSQAR